MNRRAQPSGDQIERALREVQAVLNTMSDGEQSITFALARINALSDLVAYGRMLDELDEIDEERERAKEVRK